MRSSTNRILGLRLALVGEVRSGQRLGGAGAEGGVKAEQAVELGVNTG